MKVFNIGDKVRTNCYKLGNGVVSSGVRMSGAMPLQKVVFDSIPDWMAAQGQTNEIEIYTVELIAN
tara:strand:- start:77 stop:274 length:198 start_codon:yes stop_codon:yes gene_type:complete